MYIFMWVQVVVVVGGGGGGEGSHFRMVPFSFSVHTSGAQFINFTVIMWK